MAKRGFSSIGRLMSCFVMVYLQVVTSTKPSNDEAEAAPPPDLDSFSVEMDPDSTTGNHSDTFTPGAAGTNINGNLHAVIRIVQEKDLGKAVIAFAIPIATAIIVTAGKGQLAQSEMSFVLVLVCLGFTAIFNGILLKETFPKFAQIVEPVGILLVATSFFAIVAFFLPAETSWVPTVCIGLCLLPFFIALCQTAPLSN